MGNDDILAGAKKALAKAQAFTKSTESQDPGQFAKTPPKPTAPGTPPRSQYSEVRDARKAGEFMGVRSDQAGEIKSAQAARGQYKDALKAAGQ